MDPDEINERLTELGNDVSGEYIEEPIEVLPIPKRPKPKVVKKEVVEEEEEPNKVRGLIEALIDAIASILCYLDLIGSSEELGFELKGDDFVISDMTTHLGEIVAYIPFVGLVTGGTIIARHIASHKTSKLDETPTQPVDISSPT